MRCRWFALKLNPLPPQCGVHGRNVLNTYSALDDIVIDIATLLGICEQDQNRTVIYLWCEESEIIFSHFFYVANGALFEDSGTGSACTNLGAYFL